MNNSNNRNAAAPILVVTILLAIGYAILRYLVLGDVLCKDFPILILNKGLSLGVFIIITLNFALGPAKNLGFRVSPVWLNARKALGMSGFLFILCMY